MYDQEREEVLAGLPQAGPVQGEKLQYNAHVCVYNGVVHIYPVTGGWLGMKIDDVRADVAPWSD
jgi:hypothetical protein